MQIDLKVPNSLDSITLEQYQEFIKVKEQTNDHEFLAQKMISIFCDITMKEVLNIKYNSLVEVSNHFIELFETKPEFKTRFEFNGIEFGFIPKLDDISLGEYIDLEKHLSNWNEYHKALAILYRPITNKIGSKYEIRPYEIDEDTQELMKQLPVSIAISSTLFFYHLGNELLTLTLESLNKMTQDKKLASHLEQSLQLSGVGINQYMQSLRETLQSLRKSQDLVFTSALLTSRLKPKRTK
jgi:hypothetical protein